MKKNEILDFLRANKDSFFQRYHISNLVLFGSFARGDNKQGSDVDILYRLSEGCKMSFDSYVNFENELSKAFGTKIDLINEKKLNPLVKIEAKKDFIYV